MVKVKVYVTLKESVLDPQGKAVSNALHSLGYEEVKDVRIGKYMELFIETEGRDAETVVREACEKLLSNPVIEDYRYEIEEALVR
ncbi:phosphoribosylformylglycinamidine synthase subunit PurS [Bacillus sp. FJAT-27225]|uniref:phosphoribosylformylglycinamidine synthase subunit PurS n=1 Tax=Bacillus sp. FJAT-27225 TaxID=1743144 RepID=UPI00080C2403|nr:phosphoribosylformylglycinamidine synthase subunit PurS [Bacillus sp. FJAT-27225]OCA88588.1 phosphoribosylformylglycinamidine synthase subunit PurS [Bacillus sp. FJAT-27225]